MRRIFYVLQQENPTPENRVANLMAACRDGKLDVVDRLVRLQGVAVDSQEYEVRQ